MNSSIRQLGAFRPAGHQVAIALAFASLIGGLSMAPAFAARSDEHIGVTGKTIATSVHRTAIAKTTGIDKTTGLDTGAPITTSVQSTSRRRCITSHGNRQVSICSSRSICVVRRMRFASPAGWPVFSSWPAIAVDSPANEVHDAQRLVRY